MTNKGETNPLIIILIIAFLLVALFGVYYKLYYDYKTSTFRLNGEATITKEIGSEFKDPGFVAIIAKKDRASLVKVESNVDTNKLGTYKITYTLKYKFLEKEKTLYRKVEVVDTTKPVLKINSKKNIYLTEGDKYSLPTYKAIDNVDGNITKQVKVKSNVNTKKPGTYKVTYTISDSSKNVTTKKIIVKVREKVVFVEPKEIKINFSGAKSDTYIVVSISSQALNYYRNGKLYLASPVVTGINNGTPLGTYKILGKARNTTLRGIDYTSFVNYWMSFIGGSYGIHDATWRDSFGGDIYKTSGSHGCINMPYYKAQQLYNIVDIGTPVYIKN